MAALKELKARIASVQSTLKITSAMKMVASAKLHRVQSSMEALADYEHRFSEIVAALCSDPDVITASPLTTEHKEKRHATIVAFSSDNSLCGAFNANVITELHKAVKALKGEGFREITVFPVGEKMVQGRIKKYYEDFCLLEQPFVKDSSKTIGQLVTEAIAAIGEKITVRRFVRYEMGEGIEKKKDDLAEEVEKQVSKMKG